MKEGSRRDRRQTRKREWKGKRMGNGDRGRCRRRVARCCLLYQTLCSGQAPQCERYWSRGRGISASLGLANGCRSGLPTEWRFIARWIDSCKNRRVSMMTILLLRLTAEEMRAIVWEVAMITTPNQRDLPDVAGHAVHLCSQFGVSNPFKAKAYWTEYRTAHVVVRCKACTATAFGWRDAMGASRISSE